MPNDYEYDLFISYRRTDAVMRWIKNHFHPLIRAWLSENLTRDPKIFIDWEQETGVDWPTNIRVALQKSRYLVAIWSPQYFTSEWCVAEWESMLQREKLLGMRSEQNTKGLVYSVVYSDGNSFPHHAKTTINVVMEPTWRHPHVQFNQSLAYLDFDKKIQEIAEELSSWINTAPQYRDDWPVVLPSVCQGRQIQLPRF